jgi:hypothetical protein
VPPTTVYPLVVSLLLIAWLGLLLLLALSWPTIRKLAFPAHEGAVPGLLLVGTTVVGGLLRFFLSPDVPMLAPYGGLSHVLDAYALARLDWSAGFEAMYPQAVSVLAALGMKVFGLSPEVYFKTVAALSTLLAPAIYLVARFLWGRPYEACIAALLAAVCPPLLTFSGCASLEVPCALLGTLAMALLLAHVKTGTAASLGAALCAAFLAVQTRPEAVLFLLPFAAAPLLLADGSASPEHASGCGSRRSRSALLVAAFLLCLIPYLITLASHVADQSAGEDSPGWQTFAKWLVRGGLPAALFLAWGWWEQRRQTSLLAWGAALLALLYFLVVEHFVGWQALVGGPVAVPGLEHGVTFTPILVLFLNPKLIPLPVILFSFLSVSALAERGERKRWLLLVAWFLPLFAISMTKVAGELPYSGVRLALPAVPPFLLLASRGAVALVFLFLQGVPAGWFRRLLAAGTALLALASFVEPVHDALDADFDQQNEYLFVRSVIDELPAHATVVVPGGLVQVPDSTRGGRREIDIGHLFRTKVLFGALLGENRGNIRVVETRPDLALDLPDAGRTFFYQGLDCFRTASKTEELPACRLFRSRHKLERVKDLELPTRIYTVAFASHLRIARGAIPLALFEVER